ncbi:putative ubiquitin carboxyl-terminal hydrolase [Exophiala viscosa]|uniref:Ubiquitin carboxyl-terminal hydrolase n=1 Tax=Exophiala viscosa TaxID=2486360 RepID=A0AAN6E3N5_9EURO|nr:putative ubiquitin carboxyl-terminal hydrolase [Exophiala viscosa]
MAPTSDDHKTFIPLENNPEVMTSLAHQLGLSSTLAFHDVYSLTDPDLLALLPRPANALLFVYPCTKHSEAYYAQINEAEPDYDGAGSDEPVMFYRQIIHHACGLIGLLHCVTNGSAADHIHPSSDLEGLIENTRPLQPVARAQYLHDSDMLEEAHSAAAELGDTTAPPLGEDPGHAFIAFVKGKDGHLHELEGRRKGPVDLGELEDDKDVLSEKALSMGPLPFIQREEAAGTGVLRFSCTVLGPAVES